MKIVALIPARGGSKGLIDKNIKSYRGKPLIYYSINLAKYCKYITDIVVTTDYDNIKEVALKYGARVPFKRPSEISQDLSRDEEFIDHYLNWTRQNEPENMPDLIVQLRPTYPNRRLNVLDFCIEIMMKNPSFTSLRTVTEYDKSPFKMYTIGDRLIPLFEKVDGLNEPYNRCRQELPKTYLHNGYIDIIRVKSYFEQKSITGNMIYPYIMDKNEVDDIDNEIDWCRSEANSFSMTF